MSAELWLQQTRYISAEGRETLNRMAAEYATTDNHVHLLTPEGTQCFGGNCFSVQSGDVDAS